ncbi:hypothetical protein M0804_006626 [Polistes exclamans]|nr:hypothetical protein M0804_006626 [Polistes exclamans]
MLRIRESKILHWTMFLYDKTNYDYDDDDYDDDDDDERRIIMDCSNIIEPDEVEGSIIHVEIQNDEIDVASNSNGNGNGNGNGSGGGVLKCAWAPHVYLINTYLVYGLDDGMMDHDTDGDGAINLSTSQRPSAATTPNGDIPGYGQDQQDNDQEGILNLMVEKRSTTTTTTVKNISMVKSL